MVCRSDECGTTFTIQLNEQRGPASRPGEAAAQWWRLGFVPDELTQRPGTPLVPDYWQAGIGAGAMAEAVVLVMTIQHPSLLLSLQKPPDRPWHCVG